MHVRYHNAAHAANVVWALQYWLRNTPALYALTPLQYYSALMAAAMHDYMHPYAARCRWWGWCRYMIPDTHQ